METTNPNRRRRGGRTPQPWDHGEAYSYRRCREGEDGKACRACKDAHNAWAKARWAERKARIKADPSLAPHGIPGTYSNWGCRCDPCTDAASENTRVRYQDRRAKPWWSGRSLSPPLPRRDRAEPFGREWLNQ
jgi:hypothetical protein